ncbi:MAG: hypothetical protein HFJ04_06785 [Lachnospiraceae bacterium]|nr:hypothetical protein [Lachnospiraceae bacterium]
MAKSKELKVETPVVEAKKNTETKKTETKKAEAKQTEVKKEETKKPDVKKAEVKNTEAAKTVKAETEPAKAKAEVPAEKETEAAEAAKKAAAKVKKTVKEKSPVIPEVFIQYQEQQTDVADIVAKVKELYVAQKHRESSIKSLQVYIKPQDGKAYYVINDKITGDLDLF